MLTKNEADEQNYKWYKKVVDDSSPFWLTKALKTYFIWFFVLILLLVYLTSTYVVIKYNLSQVGETRANDYFDQNDHIT